MLDSWVHGNGHGVRNKSKWTDARLRTTREGGINVISHYDDPTLLAQLANTMHAYKGDQVLSGQPNGTVVERVYGTERIARRGRLVRVSIEWEEDGNQ
jgi:hypothetical protein